MKLEDQVVSLELAKELGELGICAHSIFCWRQSGAARMDRPSDYRTVQWSGPKTSPDDLCAYTVAELGAMLPSSINNSYFVIEKCFDGWYCQYRYVYEEDGETLLSNCLAKILIWLIENKHVSVESINNGDVE